MLPVLWRGLLPLINHAAIFLFSHNLAKGIFPLYRPAFTAGARQAVERESMYAFLFQMQESGFDQRIVIGGDVMDGRILLRAMIRAAYADNGHFHVGQ